MAEDGSGGFGVEGAAGAVRRNHALFLKEVITLLGKTNGNTAGQRHVTLIGEQRGGRLADRDERGGAGGLDGHARSTEVELVGNADGKEILVVSEHRLVFGNLIVSGEFLALAEIVQQVGIQAESGIDADHAGVGVGIVSGVFERFPGAFEEHAVLRVHQLGFFRIDAEKRGVEQIRIVEHAACSDIFAAIRFGATRKTGDAVFTSDEILPELVRVLCAGETAGHADDGDGFR